MTSSAHSQDDTESGQRCPVWVSSDRYRHGLDLLNRGHFFDAHEALEDVWREAAVADRQFLQGLIQVAVALHHHSRGNQAGARSVLARAAANLAPFADAFGGIRLQALRSSVHAWRQALDKGGPEPPTLVIHFVHGDSRK